jgi:hypothetical protein
MIPPRTIATTTPLDTQAIAAIRDRLRGELILPDDPAYEDARRVWNGMIDKRPVLIVRCAGVAGVIRAVGFAREHELWYPGGDCTSDIWA